MELSYLIIVLFIISSDSGFISENVIAYITASLGVFTGLFAVISAFVVWRIDRKRLSTNESDIKQMKKDLELHKQETIETFKEIRKNINDSNSEMVNKIISSNNEMNDNIKDWMKLVIHSNINERGLNEKDRE